MTYLVIFLGLATLAASYFIRELLARQRRRRLALQSGCQPIPLWSSSDPLGREYAAVMKESWQQGRFRRTCMEQYEKVGSDTYLLQVVGDPSIHTSNPLNYQVIATNVGEWRRDIRKAGKQFNGGDDSNIVTQEGALWRRSRSLVTPLFHRAELRDVEFFEKFVDRLIDRLPRDGRTIDFQDWSRKLYLDTTTEFCFGEGIDSLRDDSGQADAFISAFERATAGHGKRVRQTGWHQTWAALTDRFDKPWLADCKVVHDYIDGCIARHRSRDPKKAPPTDEARHYVLLDGMSDAIADPVWLRFQLLGIFSSGREVAAMALANLVFLLARNPRVWEDLRRQALQLTSEDIRSFDRLHQLTDFKHAVYESLRMLNPVARLRRIARVDTVLPRGGGPDGSAPCLVPKGTIVWIDKYPMARNPQTWGEDVDAFRPDRFDNRATSWEFRPFSAGPRVCPAQQQVVTQLVYVLVRLTREFETLENRDPCFEYIEGLTQCIKSQNGVKVALHPARPS